MLKCDTYSKIKEDIYNKNMDYSYNIKDLCAKFDDRQILKDLSFSLSKGLCVIKGKSGCGKSTLIDILLGLGRPDKGKVFLFNKDIYEMPSSKRREYVFSFCSYAGQKSSLIYEYSLKENFNILNKSKEELKKADELIKDFKFDGLENKKILELSGGERQKAEIISCLSAKQFIYILDEPFSSIEKESRLILKKKLLQLSKNNLVIIVDHSDTLNDITPDTSINFIDDRVEINSNRNEKISIPIAYKNKGKISSFSLLKSYFLNFKLDFVIKSLLILCIFIFFGLTISFTSTNTENEIYSGDTLMQDPFAYHRINSADAYPFDEKIIDMIDDDYLSECITLKVSETIVEDNVGYTKLNDIILMSINDDRIENNCIYYKDGSHNILSNNEFYLDGNMMKKEELSDYNCPDFYIAKSIFEGYEPEKSLIVVSNDIFKNFLNDGFSSLSLQRGNLYLPVNFTIKDSKIYYSDNGYGNPFIVDPSKRNYLALKGLKEDTEVELLSEEKIIYKIKTTDSSSNDNVISPDVFRNLLSQVTREEILFFNKFNYSLVADKKTMKTLVDNGLGNHLSFKADLIKFSSSVESNKFLLFLYLFVGFVIVFIIYLFFSLKGLKKWSISIFEFYKYNGLSTKKYIYNYLMIYMIPLVISLSLSIILYYSCFVNLSNYILMIDMYGSTRPDGFYYYSKEPQIPFYDHINSPLAVYTYENVFFIIFILALFVFFIILLSMLLVKRKKK